MANDPKQQSLFPVGDSLEAVVEEAKAALPITDENDLIVLLQKYENTLLQLIEQHAV